MNDPWKAICPQHGMRRLVPPWSGDGVAGVWWRRNPCVGMLELYDGHHHLNLDWHRISPCGCVEPFVVCLRGCGWHEVVLLAGWAPARAVVQASPAAPGGRGGLLS